MSVHRYEHGQYWPHLRESNCDHVGAGPGVGYNVNVALNTVKCGTTDYVAIFNQVSDGNEIFGKGFSYY